MKVDRDQRFFEELRRVLTRAAGNPVFRVILYGSRATGTAGEESDFDILVVEKGPVSKLEERRRLRSALCDFPYPVDLWVMSEEEFEETRNVIGGLAYPADKYGVVLQ